MRLELEVPEGYRPDPLLRRDPATTARVLDLGCAVHHAQAERPAAADPPGLQSLVERFDRVFSTRTASADKGRAGEQGLRELLLQYFPTAEIDDVAHQARRGDLLLRLDRGGCRYRIMVESKNMRTVTAADLEKFLRDVGENRAEIDAALFVSLVSETIPRKGRVCYETCGGRPVLYVAAALGEPERLRLGVESLLYAAADREARPEGLAEQEAATRTAVSMAYEALDRCQGRVRALRESAEQLLRQAAEFEGEAAVSLGAITALWERHPQLRAPARLLQGSPLDRARYEVQRFQAARGRLPSRKEATDVCQVPESVLRRAGGVRGLAAPAAETAGT